MQLPRQRPMTQRLHRLDQARNASRSLRMSDIGLHRSDEERAIRRPIGEHLAQRVHLDGIAERRSGAVRLDEGDFARR